MKRRSLESFNGKFGISDFFGNSNIRPCSSLFGPPIIKSPSDNSPIISSIVSTHFPASNTPASIMSSSFKYKMSIVVSSILIPPIIKMHSLNLPNKIFRNGSVLKRCQDTLNTKKARTSIEKPDSFLIENSYLFVRLVYRRFYHGR